MNFVPFSTLKLPIKRNSVAIFTLLLMLLLTAASPAPSAKVFVLGIAQDGGIPHLGCRQKICLTQRHFVTSLAVESAGSLYLFDASPDLRAQYSTLIQRNPGLFRKNIFDAVFLTHAHIGHYTGLMFLGKESVATRGVPVYCSGGMRQFLSANAPWNLLIKNQNIVVRRFMSGQPIALPGLTVTPLEVPHRKEFTDMNGFLLRGSRRSLLFIPDIDSWEPVKDSLAVWLKEVDYALLDGTFYSGNELPGRDIRQIPHPTIENSIATLHSLAPFLASIFFIHLNHTNPLLDPDSPESKKFSASGYHVAAEWQEFDL